MPQPDSDAALVQSYRAGDRSAFDALYDKYAVIVFRHVRSLAGNADAAEEITQETFIAALDALRSLRQTETVLPFLLGIATRRWHSYHRRRSRRARLAPEESWAEDETVPPRQAGSVEEAAVLRAATGRLPDGERAVFLLVAQAGLSHREAADALGLPLGVVKWRLARALKQLRRDLGDEEMTKNATRVPFPNQPTEVLPHVP